MDYVIRAVDRMTGSVRQHRAIGRKQAKSIARRVRRQLPIRFHVSVCKERSPEFDAPLYLAYAAGEAI